MHQQSIFSKVISEIAGKLLGIPMSLAAVIPVLKSDSILESLLIMLGLLLASVILSGAVANQQSQLIRISHAKRIIFDAFEGKQESYPESLKDAISQMVEALDKNEKKLCRLLWSYRVLSWLPVLTGLIVFLYRFSSGFNSLLIQ